jgi:GNAT superfamily N-acetyltransferase
MGDHPLAFLLDEVAVGRFPDPDGSVTILAQPSPKHAGVFAFTAHSVICTDADPGWVRGQLPPGDLSAPMLPPFLAALADRTGRRVNSIDMLCVAAALPGPPAIQLSPLAGTGTADNGTAAGASPPDTEAAAGAAARTGAGSAVATGAGADHPRVARALRYRDDVRAWQTAGGVMLIGQGVAGRWETAIEVDPGDQGKGLGRELALAARHLVPDGAPIWAQIAPGNAASVRAFLAAGFRPAGAEALLLPGCG